MAFEEGHKKVGGRTKGVPNKTTIELRILLRDLINEEFQSLPETLDQIQDPVKRLKILTKLMPYVFPKMQTIDLVDAKEKDCFSWD